MTEIENHHGQEDLNLAVLYKHWITADSINHHLRRSIEIGAGNKDGLSREFAALAHQHSVFLAISVWYSLLWVVVEGYQELELADERIDELLNDESMKAMLRRFRNAVFHVQRDPMSPKIMDFLTASKSEKWIAELNAALEAFFVRTLELEKMAKQLQSSKG